jgi:hypothetical protein
MPCGCVWPCLGFSIANHYRHQQVGIIVGRPKRMRDAVAQLAAFMNGAGCFGRTVTADPAGEGKFEDSRAPRHCLDGALQ